MKNIWYRRVVSETWARQRAAALMAAKNGEWWLEIFPELMTLNGRIPR